MIDFKIKFNNKLIPDFLIRFFVIIVIAFFSLFLSCRKGFEIIEFINEYVFFLPVSFTAFVNFWIFLKKGDFRVLMKKLGKFNGEDIPEFIFFFLEKIIPFCFVFIVFGFFFNIFSIYKKFGGDYIVWGSFFIVFIILPFFVGFFLYKDCEDGKEFSIEEEEGVLNNGENLFEMKEVN